MSHREWCAEVSKQIKLRSWSIKTVASMIDRSYSYVASVCSGRTRSKELERLVSDLLGIETATE